MALTLRSTKGSALTHDELDANFSGLADGSLISAADASVVNFTPSGSGATNRTMQDKAREIVSVKDFGAKGDGTTDDSTAIQAAIDAVIATIGGGIYVPQGRYYCGSALTIDKNAVLTIYGVGGAVSAIHSTGRDVRGSVFLNHVGGALFILKDTAASSGQRRTEGITFDGIGVEQFDDTNDIAFQFGPVTTSSAAYPNHVRFVGCAVLNGKRAVSFTGNGVPFDIKWERSRFEGMENAVYVPNKTDMPNGDFLLMQWEDCVMNNCTRNPVEAIQGNSFYFKNCRIEANTLGGLYLKDVTAINLDGNHFEQNSPTGAEYDVYVLGTTVKTLTCAGNTYTRHSATSQSIQFRVEEALSMLFDNEQFTGSGGSASLSISTSGGRSAILVGGVFDTAPTASGATIIHLARSSGHLLVGSLTDNTSGDKNGRIQLVESSTSGVYLGNTNNTGKKVLDWYEEGTWTPSLLFGGGNTGMTYTVQTGNYVRIGNTMMAWCRVVLSAKGTSTGVPTITGLPYSTVDSADQNSTGGGAVSFWSSFAVGVTALTVYTTQNSATLNLRKQGTGGLAAMSEADFTDTSNFNFHVVMRVA